MSILHRRRRPTLPAVAPPLEDDNLLSEILLRLPPQPSSLPRAAAVCKRWRSIASDPGFSRRFRRHHRRNPSLLGFFDTYHGLTFQPTLDPPDQVPPGRFSFQLDDDDDRFITLGCRHGLVLMLDPKRKQVLVWDPVTGDQHRIALPPRLDADNNVLEVMRAEGGGLGLLFVLEVFLEAQLWKRKTDCDGVGSWVHRRTIKLDKLLSLDSKKEKWPGPVRI